MGRVQREYSQTGYYHIMLRGNERKDIFRDDEDRERFLDTLVKKKKQTGFKLYAYCLMNNHIHLLINDEKREISIIMKGMATGYAMFFNHKYLRVGHVFQDRFKSEPIENDPYLLAAIRYIHANPVKAGLVKKPEQYIWSSYRSYIGADLKERLVDKCDIYAFFSRDLNRAVKEFKNFSHAITDSNLVFLDDDHEGITGKMQQGRLYLQEYLKNQWPDESIETICIKPHIRKKVISELKTNTALSIRNIAELLGVNRNLVERVKVENKKGDKKGVNWGRS